jgi:hypothetical protein
MISMNGAIRILEAEGQSLPGQDPQTGSSIFDYGQLPSDVAATVRESADRIHSRNKNVAQEIFRIGRELHNVKDALPHGAFGPWLEAEFGWNERTAQRYMRAAEVLGDKSDTVSVLGATAIYKLSAPSTPPAVRKEIVARLESGEHLSPQAVLEQVKKKRQGPISPPLPTAQRSRVVEQQPDEPPAGQFCQPDSSGADKQASTPNPARGAADLILEQFDGDWNELARCLAEADAGELLGHLLQGCASRGHAGGARPKAELSAAPSLER